MWMRQLLHLVMLVFKGQGLVNVEARTKPQK
jgi:hypothetical protein